MAEAKTTKAQTVNEENVEKAEANINQVANVWTETLRDAGEAVAGSAVAMQDCNLHFAQSLMEQSFEQIESQTKALHKLYTTVADQSHSQRAAFRHLTRDAVTAYTDILTMPVKLYRQAIKNIQDIDEE